MQAVNIGLVHLIVPWKQLLYYTLHSRCQVGTAVLTVLTSTAILNCNTKAVVRNALQCCYIHICKCLDILLWKCNVPQYY